MVVELADDERPNAERVASADQFLVGQADQRIGPLELAQRLDETFDDPVLAATRDEMEDDLRIGGRLVDGSLADKITPQSEAVCQIAIMGDGEAAGVELGEKRLNIAQDRPPVVE